MGQLIVRNVEDELIRALKQRASRHGRSAEAEHREILRKALAGERSGMSFKEFLASIPAGKDDQDFERLRDMPRPVKL